MRLFVAAELSEPLLEALAETQAALRDCVRGRYVAPDSFHVTLAFLGNVDAARIDELAEAILRACDGHAPVSAATAELGSFGRRKAATLWQKIDGGAALPALAADLRSQLTSAGFAFDEKTFLAHVTLMRHADLTAGLLPMPVCAVGSLSTVTLFRSDLSGPAPRYEPLERIVLA